MACVASLSIHPTLASADDRSDFLVKLFAAACIPNMGNPDGVRAWAAAHKLNQIQAATPLQVFVGPGDKGDAWAVPTPVGNFALSLRGRTQACAVWAQAAEPAPIEAEFKQIIDEVKRPGIKVRVDKDDSVQTSNGQARELIYNLIASGASTGFEFTMITFDHANPAFQATLQVAKAAAD